MADFLLATCTHEKDKIITSYGSSRLSRTNGSASGNRETHLSGCDSPFYSCSFSIDRVWARKPQVMILEAVILVWPHHQNHITDQRCSWVLGISRIHSTHYLIKTSLENAFCMEQRHSFCLFFTLTGRTDHSQTPLNIKARVNPNMWHVIKRASVLSDTVIADSNYPEL